MTDEPDSRLTAFQLEVAQLFFSLPASESFLLAGGGGLLAQGLTARPTQDLDFSPDPGAGDVGLARDEFLAAAGDRGWSVGRVQDSVTFCRLLIHGPEDLLVDLALDSVPGRPASASIAGPPFAPDELAGPKVIALFDRAAARDFVDVHALRRRFTKTQLLDLARDVDRGFDTRVFIDMLNQLDRYRDVDLLSARSTSRRCARSSSNGSTNLLSDRRPIRRSTRMTPARWKAVTRDDRAGVSDGGMTSLNLAAHGWRSGPSADWTSGRRHISVEAAACNGRATPGPQTTVAANVTNVREARNQRRCDQPTLPTPGGKR